MHRGLPAAAGPSTLAMNLIEDRHGFPGPECLPTAEWFRPPRGFARKPLSTRQFRVIHNLIQAAV